MAPNVRVEAGQTASRQARAGENVPVPPARAWWLAVGPRLERGVRPRPACHSPDLRGLRSFWCSAPGALPLRAADGSVARTQAAAAIDCPQTHQCWTRRPNELTEDHGLPSGAVLRRSTTVPSHCLRNLRLRCSDHEPSVLVLSDHAGRCACTARSSTAPGLFRVRRRFVAVQFTPTGAESAGALHGFCCEA